MTKPHKDNIALAKFASAMSDKLAKKRHDEKHGWPTAPPDFLAEQLFAHLDGVKLDLIDVANFCMFLWYQANTDPTPRVMEAVTRASRMHSRELDLRALKQKVAELEEMRNGLIAAFNQKLDRCDLLEKTLVELAITLTKPGPHEVPRSQTVAQEPRR